VSEAIVLTVASNINEASGQPKKSGGRKNVTSSNTNAAASKAANGQ